VVLVAVLAALIKYRDYVGNPWTRNGQVSAQVMQITSRVTAPIVELPIEDNQYVHAGDLLFRIDPSDFRLSVDMARVQLDQAREDIASLEASVRSAEAQVDEAQAGVTSAGGKIGAAEADLESAKAEVLKAEAGVASARSLVAQQKALVEEAQREATRARRLADQRAGAIEEAQAKEASLVANQAKLESADADLKAAEAALAKTKAGVSQAEANLVIAQNGLSEAKAGRDSATASLDQAKATLGKPGEANVRIHAAQCSSHAAIPMMQSAYMRNGDNSSALGWLDLPFDRRVAAQGQVRSRVEVVVEVRSQDPLEMAFVKDNDMCKTLSADRTD
jgi:multidrug resistance efflux pump